MNFGIAMSTKQLEQRVARLETEFERMKADLQCASDQGWRAIVGSHEGSKTFDSVVREMRRLRREEYAEAARNVTGSQE
jgi:hypothetical protein